MKEKGQTLIEALVALGVATTIISAIVVAVVSSLSSAQFTRNQNQANHYAQEGMEIVRGVRNSSWSTFQALSSTYYCLPENPKTLIVKGVDGCLQNVGIFVREVVIEHVSAACAQTSRVIVNVSWSDGKCIDSSNTFCHKVSLASCFGNNNALPTP